MLYAGGYSILEHVVHIPFSYIYNPEFSKWHLYSAAIFPALITAALWWRHTLSLLFLRAGFALEFLKYVILVLMGMVAKLLAYPPSKSQINQIINIDFLFLVGSLGILLALSSEKTKQYFHQSEKVSRWILFLCIGILAVTVPGLPKTEYNLRIFAMGKGVDSYSSSGAAKALTKAYKVPNGVSSFAYSRDGKMYAPVQLTQTPSSSQWVYDVETNKLILTIKPGKMVRSVAFSPDGRYLATGLVTRPGDPGYPGFEVWEIGTGKRVERFSLAQGILRKINEKQDSVRVINFSPDGKYLMVNDLVNLDIWNFESGQRIASLPGPSRNVWLDSARFIREQAEKLMVVNVESGKEVVVEGVLQNRFPFAMSASADGRQVAFLLRNEPNTDIEMWDVEAGKKISAIPSTAKQVNTLAYSPNGKMLAVGMSNESNGPSKVDLWDVASGEKIKTLEHPGSGIKQILFRQDSKNLAVITRDMIAFFDVE